jgi:hypothetical protein
MTKRKYTTDGPNFRFDKFCKECGNHFLGTYNSKYCCVTCLQRNEYAANMLNFKWRLNKLLAAARNRAKSKQLPFNLDAEYLIALWIVNEGCCSVSGRAFNLQPYGKFGQVNPDAPSVDRILPEKGYVKGNVRLITYHTNVALSEFGLECFKKLAADTLQFQNKEYAMHKELNG